MQESAERSEEADAATGALRVWNERDPRSSVPPTGLRELLQPLTSVLCEAARKLPRPCDRHRPSWEDTPLDESVALNPEWGPLALLADSAVKQARCAALHPDSSGSAGKNVPPALRERLPAFLLGNTVSTQNRMS
ncbi:hypothetical protein CB1_000294029 [Camelus ferus]|nr:hypothetical protein CB1_000294029 [Camelus ferus]